MSTVLVCLKNGKRIRRVRRGAVVTKYAIKPSGRRVVQFFDNFGVTPFTFKSVPFAEVPFDHIKTLNVKGGPPPRKTRPLVLPITGKCQFKGGCRRKATHRSEGRNSEVFNMCEEHAYKLVPLGELAHACPVCKCVLSVHY